MCNYACLIQRHLDKETEQVRSTWLINRGGRGTCVGVTRITVSTGDSRDTVSLSILGTDVFYNDHLYMQSIIVYNILNT